MEDYLAFFLVNDLSPNECKLIGGSEKFISHLQ